ncbi:peptidoglycan-binding domain-containing protein [Kitasatospora sp. NPDC096128]|uniref:peptidoglycan-binding domain-containing protein n=1 Tax=Kitasatospora sp. NPDC096128 TaxID=3155547 RepID=UPI00332D2BFE
MAIHALVKRAAVVAASAAVALITVSGTASANTNAGYVGPGQANNWTAVQCVQHDINHFSQAGGGWYPTLKEDGYWGSNTDNAIHWFQNKLISYTKSSDGIVGPLTGDMLLAYGDEGWDGKCRAALPTSS